MRSNPYRPQSGRRWTCGPGHPLYTYVGDSTRGQANGNGLNLNGGQWHEVIAD